MSAILIPIFLHHRDGAFDLSQRLPPLAEKKKNPGQDDLTLPMHEAQVWVLLSSFEQDRKAFDLAPARLAILGGNPLNEAVINQMRREDEPVAGVANFSECVAALCRIARIPSARPDAPDEATRTRSCPHQGISLLGAEVERALDDIQTAPGADPRQGICHFDERPHLHVEQAIVSRPRAESFVGFHSAVVERHNVDRSQSLQNLGLGDRALRLRQLARQLEGVPQDGRRFPMSVAPPSHFSDKP